MTLTYIYDKILRVFRFVFYGPLRVLKAPKRMLRLSWPGRLASLLAVFLILLTVTGYVFYFFSGEYRADHTEWTSPQRLLLVICLNVLTPIVLYYMLRAWLAGETSRYPDIDEAWNEGLAALEQNGLDLGSIPIFLVIGAANHQLVDSLMAAAGFEYVVAGEPEGRSALRWYANDDAIFLFSEGVGCLSEFNAAAQTRSSRSQQALATAPAGGIRGTLVLGESAPADYSEGSSSSEGIRGTLVPGAGDITGTIAPGDYADDAPAPSPPRGLTLQELDEAAERLGYLGQLLFHRRQPVCPLNGLMVILPATVVDKALYMSTTRDLPDALHRDLATLRDASKLNCSVTVLITGMEDEPGFFELVRRIGISAAQAGRFGKGFEVWNAASPQNLEAMASHLCGVFEDFVYSKFREADGLRKAGNAKLFALLCRVRSHWFGRLRSILMNGLQVHDDDSSPTMFAGCYFAATGDSEDRRAFVKSVFAKMLKQEEELEWTPQALTEDARFHRFAQIGVALNVLLIVVLIGLLVYNYGGDQWFK